MTKVLRTKISENIKDTEILLILADRPCLVDGFKIKILDRNPGQVGDITKNNYKNDNFFSFAVGKFMENCVWI